MHSFRTLAFWAALAAALAVILWLNEIRRQQAVRLAQLEADSRRLATQAAAAGQAASALAAAPAPSPAPAAVAPARPQPAPGAYTENQVIVSLRESLSRANASFAELQSRIETLQSEIEHSAEERRRLAASEAELKERLESAGRILEAVQAELKTKSARITQLEATAGRLHQENRSISERLNRFTPLVRELEELNAKREACVSSVLRRYRELTEQYRALADRLASPSEGVVPSQAELSRIQQAVSAAEEDLRQLAALNVQAALLQKKIGVK